MTPGRRLSMLLTATVATAVLVAGCGWGSGSSVGTGTMNLSITDAPIDADNVTGVYITVQSVQYHRNGQWAAMEGFDGPKVYNLLELTNGESALLGSLSLPAGEYTQIRFMLDVPEEGVASLPSNPGSYIAYSDKDDDPLFIPSGAQTGYKVTADEPFTVPENGEIDVTVDFDLRKAIVVAGGQGFLLKPVLRLVVEDQAGTISGNVTYSGELADGHSLVVFTYETGEYDESEPTSGENGFANAVTSTNVSEDGEYTLAFLPAGTYDLVVAEFDDAGEYVSATEAATGVEVEAGETVTVDLTASD